ncbi:hypothetical protein [Neobacillus ginsengisoli]|uniref:Uncharacterized protein n=1 Tax=Neobacillus ginsengisoli TaxID=904295 RepID=A0ABT9XUG3_9BACI|nr:hypothetical protein [Neobacillus ginsengisoli]MDQ0199190.1 hypothetical protein [Neobacillus ginsengisoli]
MKYMGIEIVPFGDVAIRVSFGNEINEKIHRQIQQFLRNLDDEKMQHHLLSRLFVRFLFI